MKKFLIILTMLLVSMLSCAEDTVEDVIKRQITDGAHRSSNSWYCINFAMHPKPYSNAHAALVGFVRGLKIVPGQNLAKVEQVIDTGGNVLFENIEIHGH